MQYIIGHFIILVCPVDEAIFKNDGALTSNLGLLSKVWIIRCLQIAILITGEIGYSQIVEHKKSVELNKLELLSEFNKDDVNK